MRYLLFLFCVTQLVAQVTTGSLSGYVYDPANQPISGATVVVANPGTDVNRTVHTDNTGFYRVDHLAPATYDLAASASGFDTANVSGIRVQVDADAAVDLHVRIKGRRETVSVEADVHTTQTDTSDLGATIDRTLIEKLPLNERDFLTLAYLVPGVLPPVQDSALSTRGDFAMDVNGGREEFNNYLLDGVDNNDPDVNTYVLQPSVDAIQEFKIETNNYSAEYGRSAGGQVNVITLSGTNVFHGFTYEYLRNRIFDARNFFDGSTTPQLIRNQFGAGLGGPIVRNKTFFFADYDGLRGSEGYSRLATVPTAAERAGNLAGLPTVSNPYTGQPFANNQIPSGMIDPIALKILNLYPLPTNNLAAGNYLAQPVGNDQLDQYNARVDHYFSERDQLTVRYSHGYKNLFEPYTENSTTNLPGFGDYVKDTGHNALINYTHMFGPSTINTLLLGLNRSGREILQQNYRTNVDQLWGVNYLPTGPLQLGYPGINISGFSSAGDITALPIDRHTTTYQAQDNLSITRGQHSIKAGVDLRRVELTGIVYELPRVSLSFLGELTGSGIGDLLLGLPSLAIDSQQTAPETMRTWQSGYYIQDDWKVRPNLTLNLGLRYEFFSPPVDPNNRMYALDLANGQLEQVGTNGVPRGGYRPDYTNFAPRFGFSWSPDSKWVLRGGYGIFYDASMFEVGSALYFNPPDFTVSVYFPSEAGLLTLANPFSPASGFVPPAGLSTLAPDMRTPYLQSWNFNLQRPLAGLGALSIAYAGSKGTHLIHSLDLNQPPPAPGDLQSRRRYPDFSNIFYAETGGNSSFNSLQVSFTRHFQHGLAIIANYMYSKSIDDTSAFLGTLADPNFPQNSSNYAAERAPSSFDITNSATIAAVYDLPFRERFARNIEFRSILTAHGGQPFTPLVSFDNSNTGNTGGNFGSDRPNVLGSPSISNPGPQEWFNTAAFAVAPPDTFGNAGRNILRGPGLFTWDLEAARRFMLTERWSITFEAQAFNLLNHTNFDLPQLYVDQPGFGQIFSANPPRQLQFALRIGF